MTNYKKYTQALQMLEPVFREAGELAVKLQRGIASTTKLGTGVHEIDVVTEADMAVQEVVLSAARQTILSECRLVAEEETPSIAGFNPDGEFLLAVDPIDGTYRYAEGGRAYALIVSLQTPAIPLYTFMHCPGVGWTHRFVGNEHHEEGRRPEFTIQQDRKVIAYSYGDPNKKAPAAELRRMVERGYSFKNKKILTSEWGAKDLFLAGAVAGYYCEDPLAVDGLVGMHYGLAHDLEIHSTLKKEWPESGFGGIRYPGYYFVIRR